MNVLQIQDDLKNFSEDQLIKEMQQPSGSAPQFLVLSELNRRKRVKGEFAARQAQTEPTVAQEVVAAAGVPQSGMMGMSEAMAPQSVESGGIGSMMPKTMKNGGEVEGYAEGGVVKAANGLSLADRNYNPGNIRRAGFIGETGENKGYATYASPEFGLRAMSRLSGTYANKGITTIRDFINRYAPPTDNNKNNENYAKMVADSLGVGVDDPVDFNKPSVKEALIPAMAKFEGYSGDLGPNLIKSAVAASETEDVTDVNELLSGIDSLSGDKSGGEKLTADLSFPTTQNFGARNIDLGNIFGIKSAAASTKSEQSLDDKLMAEDAADKLDPKTLKMLQDSGNLTELDFVTGESDPFITPDTPIIGGALGKYPTIKDDIDRFKDNRVDGGFAPFQDPLFVNRAAQKLGKEGRSNQDVYSDSYGDQSDLSILDLIDSDTIKENIKKRIDKGDFKESDKKINIFADKARQKKIFNEEKKDTEKFKEENKIKKEKPESNYIFSDGSTSRGIGNTEQEIINLMAQLKKDRDFDKYMALAQVGLNLMDQKGYGEAAEAGLKTLGDSQQRYADGVTSLINARAKLATAVGKTQLTTKEAYDKLLALRNRLYGKQGDMGIVNAELPADVLAALKAEERFLYNYLNSKGLNLPMVNASIETNKKAAG